MLLVSPYNLAIHEASAKPVLFVAADSSILSNLKNSNKLCSKFFFSFNHKFIILKVFCKKLLLGLGFIANLKRWEVLKGKLYFLYREISFKEKKRDGIYEFWSLSLSLSLPFPLPPLLALFHNLDLLKEREGKKFCPFEKIVAQKCFQNKEGKVKKVGLISVKTS